VFPVIEPETGATVMGYDGADNLAWSAAGLDLPNAQSCDRAAAEASGRVARSTDTGTLDLLTSFDVNGNVSAINDLVQGSGHDRQMQYDALDRLTAAYSPAFGGDGWYRFGYDALDNLRTWTQPGEGQRRYDYDSSNRLTLVRNAAGAGIIGLGYDVQGNLSIKNGQGYQFDFGNRLRQATNLERYRYDGHGRRSSVIDAGSGKNRHYLYSQGGALAYLWDQGTGETTQYIQLAGSLVATRKTNAGGAVSVRYQHTDALGSPVAETNELAGVVQRTAYTPYGASIGAQKDGVGYTGHVMDGSTRLTYMQQRYMDPTVGVFLSVDPVTAYEQPLGQFHRYRYGNNNPYKFNDPDGRVIETAWDVVNIAMGLDSAYSNFSDGHVGAGVVDAVGVAIDTTAAAVPFVPGGMGTAIKAARGVEKAVESGRAAEKLPMSSPNINPKDVAGRTVGEIEGVAKKNGLVPKGPDPSAGKGAYVDPVNGNQRILVHPNASCGSHCHVNDVDGNRLDINGKRVAPESPEAHLPLKTK
jgi:RHS repeat-associated protein